MESPTLVCFGDSITEGVIGGSYVALLRQWLPDTRIINAGINGDTVLNLLRRVERDVIAHNPDAVMIMVGLNDSGATYGEPVARRLFYPYVKYVREPLAPPQFARYYRQLIACIRERTHAQIVLCTLTTLGEHPDDRIQTYVDAYDYVIRGIAIQDGLPLIDVRAAFLAAMHAEPRNGKPYWLGTALADMWRVRRGHTYEQLREQRGFRLLCDGVHLSDAGAQLVAETMLPTLRHVTGQAERANEVGHETNWPSPA